MAPAEEDWRRRVVVVGLGVGGAAVVLRIARLHKDALSKGQLQVTAIGHDAGEDAAAGGGLAWGSDAPDSLMTNVPVHILRLDADAKADAHGRLVDTGETEPFQDWWVRNGGSTDPLPPRKVFGPYVRSRVEAAAQSAPPGSVHVIHSTVKDVVWRDGGYDVLHGTDELTRGRAVVLCCGASGYGSKHLRASGFQPIWMPDRASSIPPDASVAIVGTRLSGVDAARVLMLGGHKGPIHMVSGSGLLPAVQPPGVPLPDKKLTHATAEAAGRCRTLEEVLELASKELGERWGTLLQKRDEVERLRARVKANSEGRTAVGMAELRGLENSFLPAAWAALPDEEKMKWTAHPLKAVFHSVTNPFPLPAAQLLLSWFDAGKVSLRGGLREVEPDGKGGAALHFEGGDKQQAQVVIDATGEHFRVAEGSDPAHAMLERDAVVADPLGGLRLADRGTCRIGGPGAGDALYGVGGVCKGGRYLTSGIGFILGMVVAAADDVVPAVSAQ